MSTVLVTGVAGFIGYHVAARLASRGDTVIGIDNFNDYYAPKLKRDRVADLLAGGDGRVSVLEGDFADEAWMDRALGTVVFDRVVHLGAQPGVRYSIDNPRAYARANLVGHLNMLELARERRCAHVVYASSSSVYGGNIKLPFSVDDRVDHPVSLYAATKKADELMSESYAHLYRLPQTGVRFFTVYGPWGRPDMAVWLFTSAILEGRPIKVFNHGRMQRDFTYVADITNGVIAALDRAPADDGSTKPGGSSKPHAIYNIGNNRSEELGRLIDIIEDACGKKAIREYQPMQPGDVTATYADIAATQRDLGFAPSTPIEVGVPLFVKWYRRYVAD